MVPIRHDAAINPLSSNRFIFTKSGPVCHLSQSLQSWVLGTSSVDGGNRWEYARHVWLSSLLSNSLESPRLSHRYWITVSRICPSSHSAIQPSYLLSRFPVTLTPFLSTDVICNRSIHFQLANHVPFLHSVARCCASLDTNRLWIRSRKDLDEKCPSSLLFNAPVVGFRDWNCVSSIGLNSISSSSASSFTLKANPDIKLPSCTISLALLFKKLSLTTA